MPDFFGALSSSVGKGLPKLHDPIHARLSHAPDGRPNKICYGEYLPSRSLPRQCARICAKRDHVLLRPYIMRLNAKCEAQSRRPSFRRLLLFLLRRRKRKGDFSGQPTCYTDTTPRMALTRKREGTGLERREIPKKQRRSKHADVSSRRENNSRVTSAFRLYIYALYTRSVRTQGKKQTLVEASRRCKPRRHVSCTYAYTCARERIHT